MSHLTYGANDIEVDVAGYTIEQIADAHAEVLNLSPDAVAYVDGVQVDPKFVDEAGQRVEWMRERGRKGVGEVCTKITFMKAFNVSDEEWLLCKEHGLVTGMIRHVEVLFVEEAASVLRVVRARERFPSMRFSDNEQIVMSVLDTGLSKSGPEISKETEIGLQTLKPLLAAMVRHGIISKSAAGYSRLQPDFESLD